MGEIMDIKEIAKKIENAGGNLYLVGGAVRDELIGKEPKDKDYCVTGLDMKEFVDLFPEAFIRGKDFPVFDMYDSEFALARKDRKLFNGHKGFDIITDKSIKIEEDLIRRDITINSIAKMVINDEIIDPFNGVMDIKNKIIRATSEAFSEDPLRVYRAARFAAQFDFIIEEKTIKLMNSLRNELLSLSAERVYSEFFKALNTDNPSKFFIWLNKAKCLDVHFVEIFNLIGVEQPPEYHPEGDAFNHTMEVVDRAATATENTNIRYAALVHDFGKGITPKELWPHHYTHDVDGQELVKDMCKRLKIPKAMEKCGVISCREHMIASRFNEMKSSTKVDFIERNAKTILGLKGLEIITSSDIDDKERIKFADIGITMLKEINGQSFQEEKDYIKLKEKIRQSRINWIRGRLN
jgi:tRNA nucleotidyltransferase (CCA-adding enzyme)